MIPVTKPFLPPQEEYQAYLDKIWANGWLTNMGPLSVELEEKLQDFMDRGEIIANGSFEELTNRSERFKRMVELQEIGMKCYENCQYQ